MRLNHCYAVLYAAVVAIACLVDFAGFGVYFWIGWRNGITRGIKRANALRIYLKKFLIMHV
jgi:hypothetical protein